MAPLRLKERLKKGSNMYMFFSGVSRRAFVHFLMQDDEEDKNEARVVKMGVVRIGDASFRLQIVVYLFCVGKFLLHLKLHNQLDRFFPPYMQEFLKMFTHFFKQNDNIVSNHQPTHKFITQLIQVKQ